MSPLPIIEQLDIVKQRRPGAVPVGKGLMARPLVLHRAEKTLDDGMVVAVAFATHARDQPGRLQPRLGDPAGVLDPLITVMDQARHGPPMGQGHGQRVERELAVAALTQTPMGTLLSS